MSVDEQVLQAHATRRDLDLGIAESFVSFRAGTGTTLGVLAAPLSDPSPTAWVLCHSFGSEQLDLHLTDTALSRALAAGGSPALRFHCQGYGDSEHAGSPSSLSGHLADTLDAIAHLRSTTGARSIGVLGTRFGALVAARAARELSLPYLVLIDPVVEGARYLRDLLRYSVMSGIVRADAVADMASARAALDDGRSVNVNGFSLTRAAVEQLSAARIDEELPSLVRGLIVQVSREDQAKRSLGTLRSRMGTAADLAVVTDRSAGVFGHHRFHEIGDEVYSDALAQLTAGIASAITGWVDVHVEGASRPS